MNNARDLTMLAFTVHSLFQGLLDVLSILFEFGEFGTSSPGLCYTDFHIILCRLNPGNEILKIGNLTVRCATFCLW